MKIQNSRAAPYAVLVKMLVSCQGILPCSRRVMFLSLFLLIVSLFALSGCAYTIVDDDGTKHIFGLTKIDIPPVSKNNIVVGETVSVKSIGINFTKTITGGGVSIGYNNESITTLLEEALILNNSAVNNICKKQTQEGMP